MSRSRNTLGPIIGYHGCDHDVAEAVLSGQTTLKKSENSYDWLGSGIYFWVDSPERAWEWAKSQKKAKKIKKAGVVGAFIHPGLCLNLTDYGVNESIIEAHVALKASLIEVGKPIPVNEAMQNGILMKRSLDCATINFLHVIRAQVTNQPEYDSVYGVFEEGQQLFEGSAFKAKTHVQLAVRSPECIIGYFRVK